MTEETLFKGDLRFFQPEKGYRFSVDSVLLAHYIYPQAGHSILDLGAGCGIISLILAYRWPEVRITALELQDSLYRLLKSNLEINDYAGRLKSIQGDFRRIREIVPAEFFDLVVSNPPYRTVTSGRQNPESEEAIARHELKANLSEAVTAASYAVCNRGRVAFIYPAQRLAGLMETMRENRLEPKRLQMVHGHPGVHAKMVLLEAVKNGDEELKILPPFFIYKKKRGEYTAGMAALYNTNYKDKK
ncbi:MAG: tRNA1(Val) (adenine(37)-N6)-methyltransferase [Thermodesulfobacteriota bacterium]